MPLASPTTITNMDSRVQNITSSLPQTQHEVDNWNAAAAWAPVATAFFSAAAVPSVTDLGKTAGEAAFIAAANGASDSANMLTEQAMSSGFQAYALEVIKPGNCLPIAPVVHAPPPNPPILNLSGLPPSESTLPSTTILYNQLKAWAELGTQTTPGTPPVVVPWS